MSTGASAKVSSGALGYSPFDQGGSISWSCKGTSAGTTIASKYLPSACR
jgi:hypothetical protein